MKPIKMNRPYKLLGEVEAVRAELLARYNEQGFDCDQHHELCTDTASNGFREWLKQCDDEKARAFYALAL